MSLHPANVLLLTLTSCADCGDTEVAHCDADEALIKYVKETASPEIVGEIVAAWDRMERWYA